MDKVQATCAIIMNHKGELLLTKRAREPFAGCWALPSGIGEAKKGLSPVEAVIGEVAADLRTAFQCKELFTLPIENDNHVYETVVFAGSVDESKIICDPRYSLGYQWISPETIDDIGQLAFEHNEIITRYSALNHGEK